MHVTDREVAPGPARGSIDRARRFDHMNSTGLHVLTAAFPALFNLPPRSFHMGKTVSTLDIVASSISHKQPENIERFVKRNYFRG